MTRTPYSHTFFVFSCIICAGTSCLAVVEGDELPPEQSTITAMPRLERGQPKLVSAWAKLQVCFRLPIFALRRRRRQCAKRCSGDPPASCGRSDQAPMRPARFLHAGGGRSTDPPATMGAGGFGSTPFGGASGFGTNNTGGFGSFGAGNSFGSSGGGFGASSGGGFGGASGGGASGGKACKNWNGTPGSCQYGQRCKFVHSQPAGRRACFPSVCCHNPATDAHRSLHARASTCC